MKLPPIRKTWHSMVALASWFSALVGAFLTFSVKLSLDSDQELLLSGFTQFAVAVTFGLAIAYGEHKELRKKERLGIRLTSILFVAFCILFLVYVFLAASWTCGYADRVTLVIGSVLSPDALSYIQANPHLATCNNIIAEYAGDTSKIYLRSELLLRFIVLSSIHTLLWIVSASVVVLLVYSLPTESAGKDN